MKKGINIVVLGVLTVVSVILALPFTPMRNSFKGVTTNVADKALTSMGVDLNDKIRNARLIAKSHAYESYNFINDGTSGNKNMRQETYSGFNSLQSDGKYYKEANQQNVGIPGDLSTASVSDRKNVTQVDGFVSVSTKMTSENSTSSNGGSTKQSGKAYNNGSEGGVDPTPLPSLPLGNGFVFLFSLALVYVSFKKWD